MFEEINFHPGNVVFDDFKLESKIPLIEQMEFLKEDLFQVNYLERYIIDIGWYPSFEESGNFRIAVIENYEWDNPLIVKKCNSLQELKQFIQECVHLINELLLI
jgi:hypothetical protein